MLPPRPENRVPPLVPAVTTDSLPLLATLLAGFSASTVVALLLSTSVDVRGANADAAIQLALALLSASVLVFLAATSFAVWERAYDYRALTLVATNLVRGRATRPGFRRVLRVVGYAETPQAVALGGFLPVAGPVVVVLARLLALVAGHQALEEALGLDRRRTAATTAACFALGLALSTLVKARLGDLGWWQALLRP